MKPVFTTQMKCVVVSAFVSLAFVSQSFAVLRPLFPIKPAPPFNGELIVIGDDLVLRIHKKASDASPGQGRGLSRASATLLQRSPYARATASIETHAQKRDFVEPEPLDVARFVLDSVCHRAYKALS
jgi:hypothetical protein